MKVKVKVLHEDAKLPLRGTSGAAGYDLYANETVKIESGRVVNVPVGLSMEIPAGTQLEIRTRSGLGKKGIFVINSPGTVDEDYRGPIGVMLMNTTGQTFLVEKGDRIAQAILMPYYTMEFEVVEELSDTQRGEGAYGSTGMK